MNYTVAAKNNDEETAQRINDFSSSSYLKKGVKEEHKKDFIDNIGNYGRYMIWWFSTLHEAEKFAEECRDSPNSFEDVRILKKDGSWNLESRLKLLNF